MRVESPAAAAAGTAAARRRRAGETRRRARSRRTASRARRWPRAGDLPGGVGVRRWAGCASAGSKRSARNTNASGSRWQRHVVVDHQQPVVVLSGMLGQERVEVLERPRSPASVRANVTSWRERSSSRGHRAAGSGRRSARRRSPTHAASRPLRRGPPQPRALQGEQVDCAGGRIPNRRSGGRANAEHQS